MGVKRLGNRGYRAIDISKLMVKQGGIGLPGNATVPLRRWPLRTVPFCSSTQVERRRAEVVRQLPSQRDDRRPRY